MLIVTALVVLLSVCDGKRYPLESSTVTQKPNTSKESKRRKPSLNVPKLWRQKSKSVSDEDVSDTNENSNDSVSEESTKDEDIRDDTPKEVDDEQESKSDDAGKQPEPQTNNQTLYINMMAPPAMLPHQQGGRPMPYGVTPQRYPSATPPRNKSSSLLSALLGLLLPRPQNIPPGMPGMPPSTPQPIGISPIAIMLLATKIWDFFFSSHTDAFIPSPNQHFTFERLNDRYRKDGSALRQALASPPPGIRKHRWNRVFRKRKKDAVSKSAEDSIPSLANGELYNRTVIIVDMKPDSRVGNGIAEQLRDTVSFLLEQHRDHIDKRNRAEGQQPLRLPSKILPSYLSSSSYGIRSSLGKELEVVLFLDSPGGSVSDYGLASSQLQRLRNEPHVTLTICVDRVAASGGYMMACQATPGHLYAAPFAMLGSIGVIMETVNVNEVLRKYGVNPLIIKAGKNKAALSTLGEVTTDELQMAQNDADVIHSSFQQWVLNARPNVVASKEWIEKVCNGSVFLGNEAKELGLVDRVVTSDEYVAERISAGDRVLRLMPYRGQFMLPIDLLQGLNAEGRANIKRRIQGLGKGMFQLSPLFRVVGAVGILNVISALQFNQASGGGYSWSA